jgi:lipid A ethanolaminephosphotransferase
MYRRFAPPWSTNALILAVAAFLVCIGNASLFSHLWAAYPDKSGQWIALATIPLVLVAATLLVLAPWCFGVTTRIVLGTMLILSALAAHFMDSYGVVISDDMLRNVLQTNVGEALDLASLRLAVFFLLAGLLPAFLVWRAPLRRPSWRREALARLRLIGLAAAVLGLVIWGFSGFYASLVREHKALRTWVNPGYYVYSAGKLLRTLGAGPASNEVAPIGTDARIPPTDIHRELVVLVVGETARADRFSLNGYGRETNPRLAKESVFSFTNFWACGTSTGISVPCMFSFMGEENFDEQRAKRQENVLDVLQRAGVYVLWLDNNYDSKGVADRVPYESYRSAERNAKCDEECRDEGMLDRLQEVIDSRPTGDILIVLHQMGNHGPAYHKRYPPEFEVFKPVCRSSDLSRCAPAEIGNAYDNAILYTDHFLGRVIDILKHNDEKFETAMFYLSDHGESLGEGGAYLHGLPKAIAPADQLHVPAIMWFGRNFDDIDRPALSKRLHERLTHDHLSHTLLGFMEIESTAYRPGFDILRPTHRPDPPAPR